MPLPLLIGGPIIAAGAGIDMMGGVLIGMGGSVASFGIYRLVQWFFWGGEEDNQELLDESATPIAALIEKLNAALMNIPNYNLSQHGFFKISFEELSKSVEVDLKTDGALESITHKAEALIKAKAALEMMHSFLKDNVNDARNMNVEMLKITNLLTSEQLLSLRKIHELISENQRLKDEIKQHQQQIKRLLKIVDEKIAKNKLVLGQDSELELSQIYKH